MNHFNHNFHHSGNNNNSNNNNQPFNHESVLQENMEEVAKDLKAKAKLAGFGIPLGFILFFLGGITAVSTMSMGFPPLIIIGFILFGASGFFAASWGSKAAAAGCYVSLMQQIKGTDKILIKNLSFAPAVREADTLNAVKGLLRTNNLYGYEIIGDIMVAKTSLNIKIEDILPNTPNAEKVVIFKEKTKPAYTKCPECGAAFGENEKFCSYCGARIR